MPSSVCLACIVPLSDLVPRDIQQVCHRLPAGSVLLSLLHRLSYIANWTRSQLGMLIASFDVQVSASEQHDDGYNPTNYYRTSMDGKKLHASGNSADDLTEMAKPQPEVCGSPSTFPCM